MTHAYEHYKTACICGEQPDHHVHVGWEKCPCERCQIERESFEIFGSLLAYIDSHTFFRFSTPYEDVPATFKPQEQP